MFIGREKEISTIEKKIQSKKFEFGIVYGRRRIGKTWILQEIVRRHQAIYFVANEMGATYNLEQLSQTIADYYKQPFHFDSYEALFQFLAKRSETERVIFILDEFTYLISTNSELLSVFQNAIDQYLLGSKVKMILSGSHVGMVEDILSYKKPLFGRSTFKMKVGPFDYLEAGLFYPKMSNQDKIRMYGIFGGIPFYTSKIDDELSVEDNIYHLIVEHGSIFEDEISLFLAQEVRSISSYSSILNAIASGATRLSTIASKAGITNTGSASNFIDTLQNLEIVQKEYNFGEKTNSRKTLYKISDPLFRFHYTFIEPNKSRKVIMDPRVFLSSIILPRLDEFIAQAFETICQQYLVRKHRDTILEIGRYWFNDRSRKVDIELDVVMREETKLTVFECKWTNKKIERNTVELLATKTESLKPDQLGFFSKSGYVKGLDPNHLYYTVDDLYDFTESQ